MKKTLILTALFVGTFSIEATFQNAKAIPLPARAVCVPIQWSSNIEEERTKYCPEACEAKKWSFAKPFGPTGSGPYEECTKRFEKAGGSICYCE